MINNSRGVQPKYLSPEYMDLVKTVVQECKKNGMKVWIEGDCGYPDGFAGGLISKDYPQLGMQGIIADAHCTVAAARRSIFPCLLTRWASWPIRAPGRKRGRPLRGADHRCRLPADGKLQIYGAASRRRANNRSVAQCRSPLQHYGPASRSRFPCPLARRACSSAADAGVADVARGGGGAGRQAAMVVPMPADGHLKWTAPAGSGAWELTFIRHVYRSSPTRNDNGDDGGATKDGFYSLIDYLDPVATDTYLRIIYEVYEKAVGDEFGKTVLGFRGDETDFTGVSPWTPKLLETFQSGKRLRLQALHPLDLRRPNDARGATRQGRLLGRVERHVPR